MSLLAGSAADGLLGAAVTGLLAIVAARVSNRGREEQRKDAYQRQWEEATDELRRSFESQITYLHGQISALQDGRKSDAKEIARLNRELTRRGAADD